MPSKYADMPASETECNGGERNIALAIAQCLLAVTMLAFTASFCYIGIEAFDIPVYNSAGETIRTRVNWGMTIACGLGANVSLAGAGFFGYLAYCNFTDDG